jgi:hypothetical protein
MGTAHDDTKANGLRFWSGETTPDAPHDVDIVAVQGLGADPFCTWVRKVAVQSTEQKTKEKAGLKKLSRLLRRKSEVLGNNKACKTEKVMWPRDLLVPTFTNARIATYSYRSDWRDRQVNTSLRECGQQLLEVLCQHRQSASVRGRAPQYSHNQTSCSPLSLTRVIGTTETSCYDRPQLGRPCHPAGRD